MGMKCFAIIVSRAVAVMYKIKVEQLRNTSNDSNPFNKTQFFSSFNDVRSAKQSDLGETLRLWLFWRVRKLNNVADRWVFFHSVHVSLSYWILSLANYRAKSSWFSFLEKNSFLINLIPIIYQRAVHIRRHVFRIIFGLVLEIFRPQNNSKSLTFHKKIRI